MTKLNLQESTSVIGGASEARCLRMVGRHSRRGGGNTRLWRRIMKNNCFGESQ
tara:strand:- start:94 stop:252 length:159 start_codon:yes stop_codon:yes gene_type:complete